jgi:hypothetical protein
MRLLPTLLRLAPLLLATAAAAQDPPSCVSQREGMLACFAGKACECRYDPGGSLSGRPAGFRWDCGALRPSCGVVPASPEPAAAPPVSVMPLLPMPGATARSTGAAAPYGTR